MKHIARALVLVGLMAGFVCADTLEMKDGRLLEGAYMGGTQTSIRFQMDGKVQVIPVKEILALTFSAPVSSAPQPTPKETGASKPSKAPLQYTLAAGTKLPIKMLDNISVDKSRKDDWFRGTLDGSLVMNGKVIAPKGTQVNGQVVTVQTQGKYGPALAVTLRELVVNDQIIKITTSDYLAQAQATTHNLGVGNLKIVTRDRAPLSIPYQSVVEFETLEPINIPAAK